LEIQLGEFSPFLVLSKELYTKFSSKEKLILSMGIYTNKHRRHGEE